MQLIPCHTMIGMTRTPFYLNMANVTGLQVSTAVNRPGVTAFLNGTPGSIFLEETIEEILVMIAPPPSPTPIMYYPPATCQP